METLFNFLITTTMSTGATLRGTLLPMAMPLLGALLVTVLSWSLVKYFLGDGFVEIIVTGMQTVFVASFIAVLLMAWTTRLPGTSFTVAGFFVGGMNEISMSIQGNQNITAVFNSALKTTLGMGTTVVDNCTEEADADANGSATGSTSTVCGQTTTGSSPLWQFKSMLNLGDFLISVLMRLLGALAVITTFVFYMCVLLLSIVYVDIGLILGPILLPFLIWRPTSFLFDGWLRMMISGGMYKIVASIILVYVNAVLGGFNTIDINPLNESAFNSQTQVAISLSIMLVAGAGLYLMMQVQGIVGTIVGGGGIDMSPRLARMVGNAARLTGSSAKVAAAGGATAYKVATAVVQGRPVPPSTTTSSRLGAGSRGMGRSSPANVQARSDNSNGAFGRGAKRRAAPDRRPMNQAY